jgi:hypothetical protein
MTSGSRNERIEIRKNVIALLSHVHACNVFFLNGSKIIFSPKYENMLRTCTIQKFCLEI